MTESYKKLAAIAPTSGEEKFLYAAPPNTSSLVSNITVANRSSSSTTFDVNIYQSGITQQSDIDNSDLGKVFVATGKNGSSQYSSLSTDGITWTQTSLGFGNWRQVAFGNGVFVATGNQYYFAATSTNGISWTIRTIPLLYYSGYAWISFVNNQFIVRTNEASNEFHRSTDGITWVGTTQGSPFHFTNMASGNGITIAGGSVDRLAYSTDSISWVTTSLSSGSGSRNWKKSVYGNNTFCITAASYSDNRSAASTDGISWTIGTLATGTATGSTLSTNLAYGNGYFVMVNGTASGSSTNGIDWTRGTVPASMDYNTLAYGSGVFVAIGYQSGISATSTNGITWTQRVGPNMRPAGLVLGGLYVSPNTNKLYSSSTIDANETLVLEPGIVLSASSSIVIKDGSAGNLTFSTYGVELS